jgi:hypothetical protein
LEEVCPVQREALLAPKDLRLLKNTLIVSPKRSNKH